MSEQTNEIFAAISKAQASFDIAIFDSRNPHFKNEFASLASIDVATKKQLATCGLCVVQFPVSGEEIDGVWYLSTILGHTSGQWIMGTVKLLIDKPNMQGLGSAITYARRYSKGAALDVVTDRDDDGEASVGRHTSNGVAQKPIPEGKRAPMESAPKATPLEGAGKELPYIIPFGKFRGVNFDDIPAQETIKYADWLENKAHEEQRPIENVDVQKYIRRVRDEQSKAIPF